MGLNVGYRPFIFTKKLIFNKLELKGTELFLRKRVVHVRVQGLIAEPILNLQDNHSP